MHCYMVLRCSGWLPGCSRCIKWLLVVSMDFYVVARLLMVTKALLCSHYSLLGVSSALLHGSKMFWVVSRVFYVF